MSDGPRVLVVDDELQIRRFLRIALEANGYRVYETDRGGAAVQEAARLRPDVVILDIGLPDMDGLEVLRRLREWTATPVIMLSVRDADRDKVAALDAGADDYLTKPFSVDELLARLRVAQRHAQPAPDAPVVAFGNIEIDMARRIVTRQGEPVKLTPTEYALLKLLVQHGYARVDMRVDAKGVVQVLEANPNPDITPEAGAPRQAAAASMTYTQFIERIVSLAWQRGTT